ncbi:MAG: hypothetical protein HY909_16990 [Deltaproteobacteria bacterium]|nr:hypothetical protein [Deltaproteobacteria bacterium]
MGGYLGLVALALIVGCASSGSARQGPPTPPPSSWRSPGAGGSPTGDAALQPTVTGGANGGYAPPRTPGTTPPSPPEQLPPPPAPPPPPDTPVARWEADLERWEAVFLASPGECRQVCMAAANICTAAREICRLTDPGGVGREPRCQRSLGRCTDAGRRRDATCPVCPRGQ